MTKPTKLPVRPAKTQISQGIRPVMPFRWFCHEAAHFTAGGTRFGKLTQFGLAKILLQSGSVLVCNIDVFLKSRGQFSKKRVP